MTSKELLNSLQEEINFSVKNRISPKFIEKNKILEEWNSRFELVKQDLELLDSAIMYIASTTMKDKTWNEIREALKRGIIKDGK